jgi:hypothetical protein
MNSSEQNFEPSLAPHSASKSDSPTTSSDSNQSRSLLGPVLAISEHIRILSGAFVQDQDSTGGFLGGFMDSTSTEFSGHGKNHQGDIFSASMKIKITFDSTTAEISFSASDTEQTFHTERTWIAEDLLTGVLGLWTISTNTPGVLHHRLLKDEMVGTEKRRFTFGLGNADDMSRFRQEIQLDLMNDGQLSYRYFWGVPHEALKLQVESHLRPVKN